METTTGKIIDFLKQFPPNTEVDFAYVVITYLDKKYSLIDNLEKGE